MTTIVFRLYGYIIMLIMFSGERFPSVCPYPMYCLNELLLRYDVLSNNTILLTSISLILIEVVFYEMHF